MIVGSGGGTGRTVVARFVVGENLLESMTQLCRDEDIRNGIILTGFGSLSRAVASGAFPCTNARGFSEFSKSRKNITKLLQRFYGPISKVFGFPPIVFHEGRTYGES